MDDLDLSSKDLSSLKREIFNLYDGLARLKNINSSDFGKDEVPIINSDGNEEYIFHSYKFVMISDEIYEVYDASYEKIVSSSFPEGVTDEDGQIIITEYPTVRNKLCLYLLINYIKILISRYGDKLS